MRQKDNTCSRQGWDKEWIIVELTKQDETHCLKHAQKIISGERINKNLYKKLLHMRNHFNYVTYLDFPKKVT